MNRVLVISPHPDDEAIGCGGTIRQHADAGDTVDAVFLTSGEAGGHGLSPGETRRVREDEAHAAARVLGIRTVQFWQEPDGRLRCRQPVVDRLIALLRQAGTSVIYAPHAQDGHPDHRAAARIVRAALQGLDPDERPGAYLYETWTPLSSMRHIVDISETIDQKIAAVRAYRSQCRVMDFDEAFRALARYRGEMHSWPGGPYAEVFEVMTL
jgi:LmbE family N-acetylglucosaminyl deacetylase